MSAILRRAGSKLGKLIARAADPATVAGQAQIYAKTVSGVAQLFAMAGDGTVAQLAAPSVPQIYPRYPIPTWITSTSGTKPLINTEAYANYYGKAGQALTQVTARLQVLAAGAGLTWAEIAVAKGAPVLAAGTSLTVVGFANVAAVINSLGSKSVAIPLTTALTATDDLWLIYGTSATVSSPSLWASTFGDPVQSGTILQNAVSFRPSLNVGVPTAFTVSSGSVPAFVAQVWNQ
jgi:hypothetical protein